MFYSFEKGEKTTQGYKAKDMNNGQFFLNPLKYKDHTIDNFRVIVLWTMFYKRPSSKIALLNTLNAYNDKDISYALGLKGKIESYEYIINKDTSTLETLETSTYNAYKNNRISFFKLADYYTKHPNKVKGRIMKKIVHDAQVLVEFINVPMNNTIRGEVNV